MATTKILPPEILDFPLNNTSGTTLPTGIISIIADGGAPGGTGSSYIGGNGKVPPTGGSGGGGGAYLFGGSSTQGYPGGCGSGPSSAPNTSIYTGGGGGGAGGIGQTMRDSNYGFGGAGLESEIKGTPTVSLAGGGGGGAYTGQGTGLTTGTATHGGGAGGTSSGGSAGTNGTGGGGGGAAWPSSGTGYNGGDGGDGIIIFRYDPSVTATYTAGAGGAGTVNTQVGGGTDRYAEITGGTGTISFDADIESLHFLIIGGGGGGSGSYGNGNGTGGGGAGGYRTSYGTENGGHRPLEQPLSIIKDVEYTVTVGSGGTGGTGQTYNNSSADAGGTAGGDSSISGSFLNFRPATAVDGEFRYNEALKCVEYYDGSNWYQIGTDDLTGQPTSCNPYFPANTNPIALFEFNNGTNDTCNNYSGLGTNVTYTSGKFGDAAVFDGSAYVELPYFANISQPNNFSFSFWIYVTSTPATSDPILSFNALYYNYIAFGPNLAFNIYEQGVAITTGANMISLGSWQHVVYTRGDANSDYPGRRVYCNGILKYSDSTSSDCYEYGGSGSYNGSNLIGAWRGTAGYTNFLTGKLDQVRVYNNVLNTENVADLFNEAGCGSATQTSCICAYPIANTSLYQFEDNFVDTCNSSGNGSGVNTPTFSDGKFGKAIVFNGTNQGMDVPSGILPSNSSSSSSVSFWFKNTANPTAGGTGMMFNSWDGNTSNPGYALNLESAYSSYPDGSLYLVNYYLDGTASGVNGSISYQDGLWHHIAVVFDISASTLSCYVDGNTTPELSLSGLTTSPVDPWANGGEIGYCGPGGPFRFFNGSIDQFRIIPSALTPDEIVQLASEISCT
tara:strand:+ start:346 stop:2868 length:2523 start_codon:yes stop_codon:yes gene_type:complete